MRRFILLGLLIIALGLVGCLPESPTTPTTGASSQAQPAQTVAKNATPIASGLPASECTLVTKKPTPGPTAESIYSPVSASDWVKGPADAKVTIIEYSDFQ